MSFYPRSKKLSFWFLLFILSSPLPSSAQTLEELQKEVRELKKTVQELQDALQNPKTTSLESTTPSQGIASPTPTIDKQIGAWKAPVGAQSNWRFLPDISLNGIFSLGVFREDPEEAGHDPSRTGFNLQEIEIAFQSVIDPYVRADIFLSVSEHGFELEEAYLTTLSLPKGLQLRAGQYLLPFGRQNQKHLERWAFVNDALVTQNLLGAEQLRELGIELSYLFPTPFFLQAQASFSQGSNEENFNGSRRQDFAYVGRVSASTDLTSNLTLLAGASAALGFNDTGQGNATNIVGGDLLLKWRPSKRTSIEWQTEYIYRRRQVPGGTESESGLYTYLLGQWTERWGAGLRWDYLGWTEAEASTYRLSPMVVFKPSEFFQVRAQYDYTRTEDEAANHAGFLQWIFTMGPHGAHPF